MILHVDTGQTFSAHVSGGETQPAKISIHPTIPVHVDATTTPPYSAHIAGGGAVGMSAAAPIAIRPTTGIPYDGPYNVTPSEEIQTLRTANTITLSKTVSVTPNVTAAGYVSAGTAGNSSVSLTANVPTKAAETLQPGTSAVTISAGTYLTGAQTIPAEPNYQAANIVAGKSLWGLNGAAAVPIITQDSTTKVLSIS